MLGHEHLTRGQQDFKALLTKVHGFDPDIVFFGGTTSSGGGLLRRQMGDVGMDNVPFVGGDGIADEEFVTTAGPMANDTYFTVAAPDVATVPRAKDFRAAYEARWKAPAGPYSANAYTAADVLIAAIGKAIGAANGKTADPRGGPFASSPRRAASLRRSGPSRSTATATSPKTRSASIRSATARR